MKMILRKTRFAKIALFLLLLVLVSNFLLYLPEISSIFSIQLTSGVALGSLIDLAIIAPLLFFSAFKISIKQTIGFMVAGLILARLIVPYELFVPYIGVLYAGIAIEILLITAEIGILFLILWRIPKIKAEIMAMKSGILFGLIPAVEKLITKNIIVNIIMTEIIMFYYALFTWKKKTPREAESVSMHKNTSTIAFNIMLIHAIIIETIGLHWWLHEKSLVLSVVLLILNIYSVFFFLAEIQITRLHPIVKRDGTLYITQGFTARAAVPISLIKEVEWGGSLPQKDTLKFIYKDFEELEPQAIIYLNEPIEVTQFMGRKKSITEFAIRVDDPAKLKELIN